jgi:outer membrane protein OmpA-like peptidoglycan-associated protein
MQPLIPAANSIASYGDETIVVDGSGVRGGRGILNAQQMAAVPRSTFDPGNASVSSEVGTISFAGGSANLSAQAKAVLADVAKLRAQVDGAIRIVGRGDQASARAASISRELRRLGVPSARLYDGGADSTLLGDEADIYLDY